MMALMVALTAAAVVPVTAAIFVCRSGRRTAAIHRYHLSEVDERWYAIKIPQPARPSRMAQPLPSSATRRRVAVRSTTRRRRSEA